MMEGNKRSGAWRVLGRVVLFLLGCAVILVVVSSSARGLKGQWAQAALGLGASAASLALTWVFVRWDGVGLAAVGAAPTRGSIGRLMLGLSIGLFLVAAQTGVVGLCGHVRWVRSGNLDLVSVVSAIATYLLLACREDVAFRGYPLRRLESPFGLWGAQLFVALIFAIEHVAGGYSWANAFLGVFTGSILFGMAALATRGLAMPIGLHAAWNIGQWVLGEKESGGLWKPLEDNGYRKYVDHAGMIAYLIVFGMATVAFWLYRRAKERGDASLPR
jgi:uncharacterized protein